MDLPRVVAGMTGVLYCLAAVVRALVAMRQPYLRKWYFLSVPCAMVLSVVCWWLALDAHPPSGPVLWGLAVGLVAVPLVWIRPAVTAAQTRVMRGPPSPYEE